MCDGVNGMDGESNEDVNESFLLSCKVKRVNCGVMVALVVVVVGKHITVRWLSYLERIRFRRQEEESYIEVC